MSQPSSALGPGIAGAADRFAFLAAAGEMLASSLDYDETLQQVANLSVPALADLCIVDVLEDGEVRRVAIAHVAPHKRSLLEQLARRYPPDARSPSPAGRVLASGEAELLETVDAGVIRAHTTDAEHAALIESLGLRSHLALPLVAHGQVVGVLSLGVTESERRYGADDLTLAGEIARRAALAVDNARLHRAARHEIERRRAAEERLLRSERRYRAILEQSPMSTQVLAPDGRTREVNAAWERLWGVRLADVPEYNVLADPQLEARGIAPLLRRAFAGEPVQLPTIAYDPNLSIPDRTRNADPLRWVSALAYPVRDAAGAVDEVVLIHTDVTEARVAQDRLRESEKRLHRALSASHTTVWDWDLRTGLIECSDNAVEFFGLQVGDADTFLRVIHPDDLPHVNAAAESAMLRGHPLNVEFRLRSPDGRERWVQSRGEVERDAQGTPVRFLGVTQEVTGRRRAEELTRILADAGRALGESLDHAATLGALSRVVVPRLADWYAVDLLADDGRLERIAVYHPDPARLALAHDLFERYPPRRGAPHGAWHVIETGRPEWAHEIPDSLIEATAEDPEHLRLLRSLQLGSYICVPLVAREAIIGVMTVVYAESGRHYGEDDIPVAVDIARRVAAAVDNARLYAQLQLEHRRKDAFLATLAHELRNPLAPIRSGLAVLANQPDAATSSRVRAIMERQLGQMVRLIDDLLDLSRVTRDAIELRREPVAMADVLAAALETSGPALEAAGLRVHLLAADPAACVDGDAARLAQVVANILGNAAKFTPRGGHVSIALRADDEAVVVEISDTGIGIEPAQLQQVFDMFVRGPGSAAQGGLGIGLTLARRLVELHGGRLHAESDGPGTGSRFVLRLPRIPAPSQAAPTPDDAPSTAGARRVLVVDDNTDAADTLALLLGLAGHEVHTAASAGEALEVAARARPHIAFLDLGLPDFSGLELAMRLRADPACASTRLVALTGWGREEDRRQAREAGFDDHLTKPVDAEAVFEQLARLDAG